MSIVKNNPTQSDTDLSITLTRIFDAPRPLVFACWTKKEHLDKWCAPRGFTIQDSHAVFSVGGEWRCLMIAPDGEKFPVGGVYHQIIPNELLVMSHIWEEEEGTPEHKTILTVRFADEGKKTRVTLEQSIFKSVESREGHLVGWTEAFDILGEHLAKLKNKE
jgi:uncharacterized protein YndB with AHSA1/START domain